MSCVVVYGLSKQPTCRKNNYKAEEDDRGANIPSTLLEQSLFVNN